MVDSDGAGRLLYPRDTDAGGTWIALRENGTAVVLLNGAFWKHSRRPPYRLSRGKVLLEVVRASQPLEHIEQMDLAGIEPFTLVLVCGGELWELRWDECRKYLVKLDRARPYVWSSATIYDLQVANRRELEFKEWLGAGIPPSPADITAWHRDHLLADSDNRLFTVSITSISITKEHARMYYHDLVTGENTVGTFASRPAGNTIAPFHASLSASSERVWSRLWRTLRRAAIRCTHWEYWPSHLLYAPLYPYWLWLSLRARSFFFFSAANPRIENAGFTHERKSAIYDQLPSRYYPRTHFCPAGIDPDTLKMQLANRALHFPLIAKPDIGERGAQVSLLHTIAQLEAYARRSKIDFLIQEYVSYKMEAGIFYVRVPGEAKGRVTGIVGKEFLSVTGDGHSTIRNLIDQDPRAFLQLDALVDRYGAVLDNVLPEGADHTLVPFGNHARGAKFVDWRDRITPALTDTIDRICKKMPDFYFGRLDIKFSDWQDLLQEKNFSIIELNGAGSEPTHIYDPAHSIFFAWKEILRHWRLLYIVSAANAERRKIPLMNTRDGLRLIANHVRHQKLIQPL